MEKGGGGVSLRKSGLILPQIWQNCEIEMTLIFNNIDCGVLRGPKYTTNTASC